MSSASHVRTAVTRAGPGQAGRIAPGWAARAGSTAGAPPAVRVGGSTLPGRGVDGQRRAWSVTPAAARSLRRLLLLRLRLLLLLLRWRRRRKAQSGRLIVISPSP